MALLGKQDLTWNLIPNNEGDEDTQMAGAEFYDGKMVIEAGALGPLHFGAIRVLVKAAEPIGDVVVSQHDIQPLMDLEQVKQVAVDSMAMWDTDQLDVMIADVNAAIESGELKPLEEKSA